MKKLFVGLFAALSLTGCSHTSSPIAPAATAAIASSGSLSVSGTVLMRSADGAAPLVNAEIIAMSGQSRRIGRSDATGSFLISGLNAGDWMISASKDGFDSDVQNVSLADTDAVLTFELVRNDDSQPTHPRPLSLPR